jgi:hypothetical protein
MRGTGLLPRTVPSHGVRSGSFAAALAAVAASAD